MRTPSLSRRVAAVGVAVIVTVLLAFDVFLYVRLRTSLERNLQEVLSSRAELVQAEAAATRTPRQLVARLTRLGLVATVRASDGQMYEARPPSPASGGNVPPAPTSDDPERVALDVELPGGGTATVYARRSGMNQALQELFVWEAVGTVAATGLAAVMLLGLSRVTLRPLDDLAAAARRTASGRRGERLHPDTSDTKLGHLATAYDEMLDALEAALAEAEEARARSEQAEEARSRLAALVESSDDAITGKDLDGTIVSWNRAAERMYGYSVEEAVGRHISLIVPPERLDEEERLLQAIRRGQRVEHQQTVRVRKDGSTVDVSVTISPIRDAAGTVVGASSIARDITEQRQLIHNLDTTLSALQAALDESWKAEARSRRFLADAAHQLRTPLAGIRASVETLLREPSPAERDQLLADMVRETSRAGRLLASLLRMAHLDQGAEIVRGRCDLLALCREEAERGRALAPHLDVVVRADDAFAGHHHDLDAGAVQEIVANLLDNARRHARCRIEVGVTGGPGGAEVRVGDDGPGLDEALAERVFERFVSLDGRRGSGLGLPIARALARAHGGDLVYEDRAFVLRLPGGAPGGESGEAAGPPAGGSEEGPGG